MAEYSVLRVDGSEEFGRALERRLNDFCHVTLCPQPGQALTLLETEKPQVLVLDLMLPGMDGLSFLQAVTASGRKPGIGVITGYISPFILEAAGAQGASWVMQKPCSLEKAAQHVRSLLQRTVSGTQGDMKARISQILLQLGFSAKLRGYGYLREAVYQMVLDPDRAMVKELYAGVGADFGVPGKLVEHSIRGALQEAWKKGSPKIWRLYLGDSQVLRPTSAAFITALARTLRPADTQELPETEEKQAILS